MIQIVLHKLNLVLLTWVRGRIKCPSEVRLIGSSKEFVWVLPDLDRIFYGKVNNCREHIIKIAHYEIPAISFEDANAEVATSKIQYEVIRLAPWRRDFSLPHGRTSFNELSEVACREMLGQFADVGEIWISDPFCTYREVLVPQRWRWSYRKILNYIWTKFLRRTIDWKKFPHEIRDRWDFTIRVGREGSGR